ncbi:hypothetical protein LX15_002374 [Streptoalloteichus tenebrarius]|uniref:Uncharacterized protein n=1 Tax=Streptoalloteichus tenebrarius (strain ATCC 17920 / DSM 40477 / JCM 4838 / CBS 697.72 / NBRC 16177 / NCIMB 11028 / NRRL B-12390 / A12253. 1 / ISP 5477) TaxID=1933 RepID=A0ABT1HT30_STRSD|nr:hypothetical protein [Streptoalloteichus tenebrarius]
MVLPPPAFPNRRSAASGSVPVMTSLSAKAGMTGAVGLNGAVGVVGAVGPAGAAGAVRVVASADGTRA